MMIRRLAALPRRTLLTRLAVAVLAAAVATLLTPWPARLGPATTGDPSLAEQLRRAAGVSGRLGLQAVLIDGATVRSAALGTTGGNTNAPVAADTQFEIGSITKVLTGMLLADMAAGGLVTLDTTLAEIYPDTGFADPDVAAITLAELASHRAGLPSVAPNGLTNVLNALGSTWLGANPYRGAHREDLLASAARLEIDGAGDYAYSNFGVSLLGHALAHRAGTTYPNLLRDRILGPLGMTATVLQDVDEASPEGHAVPHRAGGQQVAPWPSEGYAPAGGGVWSTANDVARLLTAVRAGTAPGADAALPRWPTGPHGWVGLGWHIREGDGQQVTWHNGGTGGSSSFAGYTSGRAVVLLSNTDRRVDALALGLLGINAPDDPAVAHGQYPMLLVTVLLPLFAALGLLGRARRGKTLWVASTTDRVGLLSEVVTGGFLLLAIRQAGLWATIPALLWTASATVYLIGCVLTMRRWQGLPLISGEHAWGRWASLAVACIVTVGYITLLVVTRSTFH